MPDPIILEEKTIVGAFSVITNLRMELFEALPVSILDEAASSCEAKGLL